MRMTSFELLSQLTICSQLRKWQKKVSKVSNASTHLGCLANFLRLFQTQTGSHHHLICDAVSIQRILRADLHLRNIKTAYKRYRQSFAV